MIQKFKVVEEYNNTRFDKWFKSNIKNLPQSLLQKLIRKNKIKINKKKTKNSYRVKSGDLIELYHLEDYYPVKLDRKIRYKANKKDLKKLSQFIIEDKRTDKDFKAKTFNGYKKSAILSDFQVRCPIS